MILIADSGSTKTDWAKIDADGIQYFSTPGMNPVLMSESELTGQLEIAVNSLGFSSSDRIYFYGAGCIPELLGTVRDAFVKVTRCENIAVHSDMFGAARALCGDSPGIVGILGTGSNSCFYNGNEILANTPPLGFILGDEGSGARLGARLVNGVFKGYIPSDIAAEFISETGIDKQTVIKRVYREPGANTFLASLVPFLSAHISRAELAEIVEDEFRLFLTRNIIGAYPAGVPVNFVGSIASVFESQLRNVFSNAGYEIGRIAAKPLPLLIDYHLHKN